MRGIGFNTFSFTSTPPVGVYYDEDANWEAALSGRNLTDEYYAAMTESLDTEFANRLPGMPRIWGAEFTYRL